jgi:broad specificity phosphatase PhoE
MLTLFYSPPMTSVDNEAGRASGHADVPLSVSGQKLARELGQYYVSEPLHTIRLHQLHIPAEHTARHGIIIGEQTGTYDI